MLQCISEGVSCLELEVGSFCLTSGNAERHKEDGWRLGLDFLKWRTVVSQNRTKYSLIFVFMVVEILEISMCIKIMQIDFLFMCKMQLYFQLGLLTDFYTHKKILWYIQKKVAQVIVLWCLRLWVSLQTPNYQTLLGFFNHYDNRKTAPLIPKMSPSGWYHPWRELLLY